MKFNNKLCFSLKNIYLLLFVIFVTGCSNNGFIVSKKVLDPFTVYSYQPLSLPPIYYLSSQEIADERRFIKEGQSRVKSLLFEAQMGSNLYPSRTKNVKINSSDEKFLVLANANQDLSQVREKLDEESLGVIRKEPNFIEKVFSEYKGDALDDKLAEYKKYNR